MRFFCTSHTNFYAGGPLDEEMASQHNDFAIQQSKGNEVASWICSCGYISK
jgi:hypothetical protein